MQDYAICGDRSKVNWTVGRVHTVQMWTLLPFSPCWLVVVNRLNADLHGHLQKVICASTASPVILQSSRSCLKLYQEFGLPNASRCAAAVGAKVPADLRLIQRFSSTFRVDQVCLSNTHTTPGIP